MIRRLLSILPLLLFLWLVFFIGRSILEGLDPTGLALTRTDTPVPTQMPSPTATDTPTPTQIPSPTPINLPTPTRTSTQISSAPIPTDTPIPSPTPSPATFVWVQASSQFGDPPHTLGIILPDGSNSTLQPYAVAPALSPGAKQIAFFSESSLSGYDTGIWIADIVGGLAENHQRLVDITDVQNITWSPDGDKLAFEVILNPSNPREEWQSQIRVIRSDPDSPDELDRFDGEQPVWSPDSQKLVIYTCRGSNCGLFLINCGGGNCDEAAAEQITFDSTDGFPAWSPDGNLAFASKRDGDHEIYLRLAGGDLVRLTRRPSTDTTPVFSPDGQKIYFRTDFGGVWQIQAISLTGDKRAVQRVETVIESVGGDDKDWGLAQPAVR